MSLPLSHSNSSPTSTFRHTDGVNKTAPRSTAVATTTATNNADNGETLKENDDEEDEEDGLDVNSLSEMSGLLTQASETLPPADPPGNQKVSFADVPDAAANTSADKTSNSSNLQEQQNASPCLKPEAQVEEDFPGNGENDDDQDNDSAFSSSSSTDDDVDDDDADYVLSIDQRRAFNVQRNQARLASLGLLQNKSLLPPRNGAKRAKKQKDTLLNDTNNALHDDDDDDDPGTPRGILLPAAVLDFESSTTSSLTTSVLDIQSRYPHRERQIQKLAALMEVAIAAQQQQEQQTTRTTAFVPAPIFLTGGAGTGRTGITLELLRHYHQQQRQLQQQQHEQTQRKHASASAPDASNQDETAAAMAPSPVPLISYLDCATLDLSTVDEFVRQVVFDLQQQQYAQSRRHVSLHGANGKKKRKMMVPTARTGLAPENHNGSKRLKSPPPSMTESIDGARVEGAIGATDTLKASGKLDKQGNSEKDVEQNQEQLPGRRRSLARVAKQQQQDEHVESKIKDNHAIQLMKKSQRKSKSSSMTAQDMAASSENAMSHSTAPTAAWKLGRIWKRAIGNGRGGSSPAGFWVIDQAHCLFSMQMSSKQQQQHQQNAEKPNLLAQILLLPQMLGLNLTIVVISNHLFLDQTRLNMLAEPSKSLATLSGAVQPIRLHFPAYRGISVIQLVLNQPRHRHLITGNAGMGSDDEDPATTSLQQKVYSSFTNALIQSVYDSTTDLKEILRLGRLLWPLYVEPLQPDRIDKTLEAATSRCLSSSSKKHDSNDKTDGTTQEPPGSEAIEGEVLAILNQKILPQIRPFLAASLYTLTSSAACASGSSAASWHELPELAKYLLLAGYLCQVNRPDRDKHLFSIQKNGRRRKAQATENTAAENVALGSTQQQHQQQAVQRIPRLRSFPMERLLSVYVSVVALNQHQESSLSSSSNAAMSFIEQTERLQSLGNNTLSQHLAYLQSTGLLHEHPPRGPADVIRLSEPRYYCSLTEDEARRITLTLNFPLDRYLL